MSMRAGTRLSTYICTSVALELVTLHELIEVMPFRCFRGTHPSCNEEVYRFIIIYVIICSQSIIIESVP